MSTTQTPMTRITADGACIRIEREGRVQLITKEQVKTVDTIQNNIIRIDIGQGPLNNIFIDHADVLVPQTASPTALVDDLKTMLSEIVQVTDAAKEVTQVQVLWQLQDIKNQNNAYFRNLLQPTIQKMDPVYVDESNANRVYRGWTMTNPDPSKPAWAIERITQTKGIILREWADGNQQMDNIWNNRTTLTYAPFIQFPEGPDS